MTNSARWLQWKEAALPPPGDARLDQDIVAQIFLKVRELYQEGRRQVSGSDFEFDVAVHRPRNIRRSPKWPGRSTARHLADLEDPKTKQRIKAGQQLPGFAWLRDDGTTSCGNWLYSRMWTEAGPHLARRGTDDPSGLGIYPNWAWSWPANRRVLYNRASCDVSGKPWDPDRRQVWWNESMQAWVATTSPTSKRTLIPRITWVHLS